MTQQVMMNGTMVQVTGLYRRSIPQTDGPPLEEAEIVVMLRGRMSHRSFENLIQSGTIRLDLPPNVRLETVVANATWQSSSGGEAGIYRHDITLRETPAAAARRVAAQEQQQAATASDFPLTEPDQSPPPGPALADDDWDTPDDFSTIKLSTSAAQWGSALRQITDPMTAPSAPPEPPLAPSELAGVEAVLVGLRLEALIEALAQAGIVRRTVLDDTFLRLIQERFETEATPVVGAQVAARALRDMDSS